MPSENTIETISVDQAVERGYFKPGRIVLTNRRNSSIAAGIRLFEAMHLGRPANWQHAMRVATDPGYVISQNWRVELEPWNDFLGCMIRIWEPPEEYTPVQVKTILEESELALGRKYDWLGILGQVARKVPWIGGWLSEKIQFNSRTFCSEFVCITERKVTPEFMAEIGRYQVSPADINDWCLKHSWKAVTFKLEGASEPETEPNS